MEPNTLREEAKLDRKIASRKEQHEESRAVYAQRKPPKGRQNMDELRKVVGRYQKKTRTDIINSTLSELRKLFDQLNVNVVVNGHPLAQRQAMRRFMKTNESEVSVSITNDIPLVMEINQLADRNYIIKLLFLWVKAKASTDLGDAILFATDAYNMDTFAEEGPYYFHLTWDISKKDHQSVSSWNMIDVSEEEIEKLEREQEAVDRADERKRVPKKKSHSGC